MKGATLPFSYSHFKHKLQCFTVKIDQYMSYSKPYVLAKSLF